MADGKTSNPEPTLVERWLQDQQQWQRTLFTYLDSMMKNDEFLMHMGNAMRGSLLAGKPYPAAAPPTATTAASADSALTADRLDKVLFALHQLQGQVQDVLMTLEEMRSGRANDIRLKLDSTGARAATRSKTAPRSKIATRSKRAGSSEEAARSDKARSDAAQARRAVPRSRKAGKRRTRS
jgi:hypothetical protein